MKRNITFPFTRLLLKPSLWVAIILLCVAIAASTLLPQYPKQLTIFANTMKIYSSDCPKLSPIQDVSNNIHPQLSAPFTLLNWNIYKQQKPQWHKALQALSTNTDFITLQEAQASPALDFFRQRGHLFDLQNVAFKYQGVAYGVNTLSKYPATSVCGTRTTEPWIRVPKTGIASLYSLANRSDTLLLINLHGINFTISSLPLKNQLQPYITLVNSHQGPVIFSGDLNTWSGERLTLIMAIFAELGFSEVLFKEDKRITIFGYPLDHIYFRGLKVLDAQSIVSDASDHNPLRVTFVFE